VKPGAAVPTVDDNHLIIPFGAARIAPEQLSAADGELVCRLPHAVVSRTPPAPLRLNSGGDEFAEPPFLSEMPLMTDQLAFLCGHFKRYCGVLDKLPRQFLDCYFAFVGASIEENHENLKAVVSPFNGLYSPGDWAFSALKPLPRAHLSAPLEATAPTYKISSLVAVDFAFWAGDRAIAIDIMGGETRGPERERRADRLRRANIQHIEIPASLLAPPRQDDFRKTLPETFHDFWLGQALPSGPFKSALPVDGIHG